MGRACWPSLATIRKLLSTIVRLRTTPGPIPSSSSSLISTMELSINVLTTDHSAIRVRLLDGETAEPIPGYDGDQSVPISGDHLFAPVRWSEKDDLAEVVGRPLRIEIQMREAQIFAIRLESDAFYSTFPISSLD